MEKKPSDKKDNKKQKVKRQRSSSSKSTEAVESGGAVGGQPAEVAAEPGPSSSRRPDSDVKTSVVSPGTKTPEEFPKGAVSVVPLPPMSPKRTGESSVPPVSLEKAKKCKKDTRHRTGVVDKLVEEATELVTVVKTGLDTLISKPAEDQVLLIPAQESSTSQTEPAIPTEIPKDHQPSPEQTREVLGPYLDPETETTDPLIGTTATYVPTTSAEFTAHWSVFEQKDGEAQLEKAGADNTGEDTLDDVSDLPTDDISQELCLPTEDEFKGDEKMDVLTEDEVEEDENEV